MHATLFLSCHHHHQIMGKVQEKARNDSESSKPQKEGCSW